MRKLSQFVTILQNRICVEFTFTFVLWSIKPITPTILNVVLIKPWNQKPQKEFQNIFKLLFGFQNNLKFQIKKNQFRKRGT